MSLANMRNSGEGGAAGGKSRANYEVFGEL